MAVGLLGTSLVNNFAGHKPVTNFSGMVIALISIAIMSALVSLKTHVGKRLNSAPILADANCSKVSFTCQSSYCWPT